MLTDPEEDYARGWVPFLDCKVFLDSRPLIPRPETEYWVEKALTELKASSKPLKVFDLFAGSGAIGIAVLKHLPETLVDFGEIDEAHFPTIEKSLQENGISLERTRMIETDVWSAISDSYDYIFANPPYLSKDHPENIQPTVLSEEPHLALFAEEDGFALIRKTIQGARGHLTQEGALFIEHDPEQSASIVALGKEKGFIVETEKDQFGKERVSKLSL